MRRILHPLDVRLDGKAEDVRRVTDARLKQLADRYEITPLGEIVLDDGVTTRLGHQLGRFPKLVIWSPVRGASTVGMVEEIRDGIDRSKFIALRATGFGATVRVDVGVV